MDDLRHLLDFLPQAIEEIGYSSLISVAFLCKYQRMSVINAFSINTFGFIDTANF